MHPALAAILLGAALVGQSGALKGLGTWVASRGETVRVVIDLADPNGTPTYTADSVGFNDWFRP